MTRTTALITGASSGLGLEFAKLFAAGGFDVVVVARRKEELHALAADLVHQYGIQAVVISKDLSLSVSADELVRELKEKRITIDILVNNAGFADYGIFKDADWNKNESMIRVNVEALTHLTRFFLPGMVEREYGKILNVASTAAFQPGPLMSVYYATKAYVLSFSEAIANETRGTGVTVSCLCPGPTRTEFVQHAAGLSESKLFKSGAMDAKTVARIGYEGCLQGKRLIIPGIRNKILSFCTRFATISFAARMARWAQEKG